MRRLDGNNVKSKANKLELAEAVRQDIRDFKAAHSCDRLIVIGCASTEIYIEPGPTHESLAALDAAMQAMEANDDSVPPSMIYAYAALKEGVPFINGSPSLATDVPAMLEHILQPALYPELYGDFHHQVRIKHAPLADGRRPDHPPGPGALRGLSRQATLRRAPAVPDRDGDGSLQPVEFRALQAAFGTRQTWSAGHRDTAWPGTRAPWSLSSRPGRARRT